MSNLYRLADQKARRRIVSFDRRELTRMLNLYSMRVASGEWRDYAIDFRPGMAIFSIFRHTAEQPVFAIAKVPGTAQGAYMVYNGPRTATISRTCWPSSTASSGSCSANPPAFPGAFPAAGDCSARGAGASLLPVGACEHCGFRLAYRRRRASRQRPGCGAAL